MSNRTPSTLSPFDSGLFALFGAAIALVVLFFTHGGAAPVWYALPPVFAVAGYCGAAFLNRRASAAKTGNAALRRLQR